VQQVICLQVGLQAVWSHHYIDLLLLLLLLLMPPLPADSCCSQSQCQEFYVLVMVCFATSLCCFS